MKKLDEIKVWDDEQRKRDHVAAIQLMVEQQLNVYAKLMENNSSEVKSPLSYNACVGLLEQLRVHSFASFIESTGSAPETPWDSHVTSIKILHGD